jgi:hypothetical protein
MGLLQKFLSDFTASSGANARDRSGYASAITVEHFLPVIFLELLGVVLAVIVFLGLEVPQRHRIASSENANLQELFVRVA